MVRARETAAPDLMSLELSAPFASDISEPVEDVKSLGDDVLVCPCENLTKAAVVGAIETGHASLPTLAHCTGAGKDCDRCHERLGRLIVAYKPSPGRPPKHNKIEVMKA